MNEGDKLEAVLGVARQLAALDDTERKRCEHALDAEAEVAFGWWVCPDGRTCDDWPLVRQWWIEAASVAA